MKVKVVITALMFGVATGVAAECKVWPSKPTSNEVEAFILEQRASQSETFKETVSGSTHLEEADGASEIQENVSKVEDGIAPAVSVTQRKTENGFEVCVDPED